MKKLNTNKMLRLIKKYSLLSLYLFIPIFIVIAFSPSYANPAYIGIRVGNFIGCFIIFLISLYIFWKKTNIQKTGKVISLFIISITSLIYVLIPSTKMFISLIWFCFLIIALIVPKNK